MLKYALLALLVSGPLLAQIPANVKVCDPSTPARCAKVDTSGNMQVTGTFTSAGAGDTVGASASLGALNDRVSVAGAGQGGCGVHVGAGLTGTLTPEISIDNGTTWIATKFIDTAGTTTSTSVLAGGGLDTGIVVLGGQRKCSVRVSAYTSGSATAFTVATTSTSVGASGGGGGSVTQGTSPWIVAGGGTAGTAATGVVTVQGIASMTKLLVTPDSVALPANQSVNVNQLAGTTTDTNSGLKSAGTMRVVLATDQPALTNKLLVTPDSVALPANQSVNVNQLAGTTTDTNSGTKSAGTLRVVLATDQPALTNKLLVTPDSVALPANQSVNVSQLAGTTTDTNSGSKSAGTLRVVLATDQPALTNKLLVTPDANSAVNVSQFGGTNVSTGTGAGGAGIPRVTISSDSSLAANQSVNMAQVAGVATATGNGTAAGAIRVALPTDGTGVVGLNAGSAIVGKVGIDQTTPGTTNGVQINAAIPAGANTIGNVGQAGAPWSENVTQLGGNSINLGTGTAGTGTARVAIATDANSVKPTDGTNTITVKAASTAATAADTAEVVAISPNSALPTGTNALGSVKLNDGEFATSQAKVLAAGQAPQAKDSALVVALSPSTPINIININNGPQLQPPSLPRGPILRTQTVDPSGRPIAVLGPKQASSGNENAQVVALSTVPAPVCTSVVAISQTSSTKLISGLSGKRIYICGVFVVSATAQSVAVTEGTGSTCGTGASAIAGSTTVANGMALAANGGWTQTAAFPFMVSQVNGDDLCLLQSGAGNVSGSISYVQF